MSGPTLLEDYLDAALPLEPPAGTRPAAEEIALLVEDLQPTLIATLRELAIRPAEASTVVQSTVTYAVLHWGETQDPASWLVAVFRTICREYRSGSSRPPAPCTAPAAGRIDRELAAGSTVPNATSAPPPLAIVGSAQPPIQELSSNENHLAVRSASGPPLFPAVTRQALLSAAARR
jgi:hypothetical protein